MPVRRLQMQKSPGRDTPAQHRNSSINRNFQDVNFVPVSKSHAGPPSRRLLRYIYMMLDGCRPFPPKPCEYIITYGESSNLCLTRKRSTLTLGYATDSLKVSNLRCTAAYLQPLEFCIPVLEPAKRF
jgi:hypothetical protein